MAGNGEKLNRIEELKNKLFSRDYEMNIEHRDNFTHSGNKNVPDSWADTEVGYAKAESFFMRTSTFKKFFKWSMIFFTLAVAYALVTFFVGSNTVSSENIEIAVLGNSFADGGEELALTVSVTNKNKSALELVDLLIEYPKSSQVGTPNSTERMRQSLGTIPAGGIKNENIKVVLFGEQGSMRPIKISIEYRVEGSNAIFIKEKVHEVSINSTPIDLSFEAPTTMSPNQDISLDIKATLNSLNTVSNVLIKVDYPVGFQFNKATPAPSLGNNVWSLGDLSPGAQREISIEGKMLDVSDGEEKTFRVWSGLRSESDKSAIGVVFNSLSHTVAIARPFIEARLYIDGVYKNDYTAISKNKINGEIRYVNNLDTVIKDLEISAEISGNAVDRKSITAQQGFYNSLRDEIVWDRSTMSKLREVSPGESGVLVFSIMPSSLFSGANILADPQINIDVSISGEREESGQSEDLRNSESKTVRIISDVGFANKALYYSGGLNNTGPIPPEVGKETTYTVVWTLSNSANNISRTQVRSTLPSWVRFIGNPMPASENLDYNASTKEITWNVGSIKRGTGISGSTKEITFQIGFTPSLSQINTTPIIINDAVLTGHDDFANVDVRLNKPSLTTNLINDSAFPEFGERVKE